MRRLSRLLSRRLPGRVRALCRTHNGLRLRRLRNRRDGQRRPGKSLVDGRLELADDAGSIGLHPLRREVQRENAVGGEPVVPFARPVLIPGGQVVGTGIDFGRLPPGVDGSDDYAGWSGLEVDELALGGYGDAGVGAEAGREGVEGVVGAVRLVVGQQDVAGAGPLG